MQIFVYMSSFLIIDLLCPMTSHRELESDKTLSGFMFRISPPLDDDLLETEGHVITFVPLSF